MALVAYRAVHSGPRRRLAFALDPGRPTARVAAALWPALVLAAVIGLVYAPTLGLLPYRPFQPSDLQEHLFPYRAYARERLLAGDLPLWTRAVLGGHPFLAEPQSAVFYPPAWLTYAVSLAQGFGQRALEVEAAAHALLAGLGVYLLARRELRASLPALLAALSFALGGYLNSYPPLQLPILETAAWLPWLLLASGKAIDAPSRRSAAAWGLVGGLLVALMALAGHPETLAYGLLAAGLLGLTWGARQRRPRRAVAVLALVMVVGLGLAAVQLLPTWDFARLSSRAAAEGGQLEGGLPLPDLIQLALPGALSRWSPLYVGVAPLLLAAVALVTRPRTTWPWGLLAVLGMLLALGPATPVYPAAAALLPPLALFRGPERAALLVALALAMLAARGLSQVMRGGRRPVMAGITAGVLLLAIQWASPAGATSQAGRIEPRWAAVFTLGSLGLLGAGARRVRVGLGPAWLLLVLLDGALFSARSVYASVQTPSPAASLLPLIEPAGSDLRVDNQHQLPLDYALLQGLEDLRGASPLHLARYDSLMAATDELRQWQLFSVGWVLTWREDLGPGAVRMASAASSGPAGSHLFRLTHPWPPGRLVHQAVVVPDLLAALGALGDPGLNPHDVAVLEGEPAGVALDGAPAEIVPFEVLSPEHLRVRLDSATGGIYLLSQAYHPGWRASIDGRPAPVRPVHAYFTAVEVPPGRHTLELVFRPPSLRLGALISGVSALVLGGGILLLRGAGRA